MSLPVVDKPRVAARGTCNRVTMSFWDELFIQLCELEEGKAIQLKRETLQSREPKYVTYYDPATFKHFEGAPFAWNVDYIRARLRARVKRQGIAKTVVCLLSSGRDRCTDASGFLYIWLSPKLGGNPQ